MLASAGSALHEFHRVAENMSPFTSYRLLVPLLLLIVALALPICAGRPDDYRNDGTTGIVRRLERVASGVRVLYVAAHPDDEDSALLAHLSLGRGARVTYMSLTRGEGGQNLLGPETGAALGAIRTGELLAAREIDGANQLFGREVDFGFSKSPDECFKFWGKENVVEDVVRAIRTTRPHIVICRFQGNAKDGHGAHQASAIAARAAYDAAADPKKFPEQIAEGLKPWRAQKFYIGAFEDSPQVTTRIETGSYDPQTGRTHAALGYRGRSMHRSQDMGMIEYEEPPRGSFYILEKSEVGKVGTESDIFDGIEISESRLRKKVGRILEKPDAIRDPAQMASEIAEALKRWRRELPDDAESLRDLEYALAASLGIRVDALSDAAILTPAETRLIECRLRLPNPETISNTAWELELGEGIMLADEGKTTSPLMHAFKVRLDSVAAPKWAERSAWPREGWRYRRETKREAAQPFPEPPVLVKVSFDFQGIKIRLTAPVQYRSADPAFGEIREELIAFNDVAFEPKQTIKMAVGDRPTSPVEILTTNLSGATIEGMQTTAFRLSNGLSNGMSSFLSLDPRATQSWNLYVPANPDERPVSNSVVNISQYPTSKGVTIISSDTGIAGWSLQTLSYRHIQPHRIAMPAEIKYVNLDLKLPQGRRIGYATGTGDGVGEVLSGLGFDVTMLDAATFAKADLASFDAVILGVRAYEVRPDLIQENGRLMDYVNQGGTLIVQYQQYVYPTRHFPACNTHDGLAPVPIKIRTPHDRVTDETAKMTILKPEHPAFNFPNKIGDKDFENWVQERGLYFLSEWDEPMQPLLECADPGESPLRGGLLVMPLGKGNYVYTGLSFFRQLPEGNEGAIKLFVNLMSLGESSHPKQ